jgi:hypothetical protein
VLLVPLLNRSNFEEEQWLQKKTKQGARGGVSLKVMHHKRNNKGERRAPPRERLQPPSEEASALFGSSQKSIHS